MNFPGAKGMLYYNPKKGIQNGKREANGYGILESVC